MSHSLIAVALVIIASNGPQPRPLRVDTQTVIAATVAKHKVTVSILAKQRPTKDVLADEEARSAFSDSVTIIQDLKLVIGESTLFVPRSSYADLVDVRTAQIEPRPNGAVLVLRGGDASTAFVAHIEFDRTRVRRRRVMSLEVSTGPTEETIYYVRVLRDVP
jgi:hypothetical protein